MRELNYIILLPLSSLLWMLGGWKWKPLRRYILPLVFFTAIILNQFSIQKAVWVSLISILSFSLPYGENSNWGERIITAISFGCISLPLGFHWFCILPPITFILTWILSNEYKLQWKICEAMIGFMVALPIAEILYKGGV